MRFTFVLALNQSEVDALVFVVEGGINGSLDNHISVGFRDGRRSDGVFADIKYRAPDCCRGLAQLRRRASHGF
ncbi:hypothetical protein D3C78_1237900 [compost metagenome]